MCFPMSDNSQKSKNGAPVRSSEGQGNDQPLEHWLRLAIDTDAACVSMAKQIFSSKSVVLSHLSLNPNLDQTEPSP